MWRKREAAAVFGNIKEGRWKNGVALNHHPFVKAGSLLQRRLSDMVSSV
ncbi:hypothetical protein BRO54_2044 [Geobacillus proteiniphilus]|uniref:Uncharacterized protein n=1 Tax=Geobacillus proteiniphilus TaxID=860353 RepID=A0A1Q5SYM4_9BACL|nr:hypothetical protein BRO54_2044 [Geobacillus proteiniphilus]